jgi:tetratricopeptide (TPR) repeat protein
MGMEDSPLVEEAGGRGAPFPLRDLLIILLHLGAVIYVFYPFDFDPQDFRTISFFFMHFVFAASVLLGYVLYGGRPIPLRWGWGAARDLAQAGCYTVVLVTFVIELPEGDPTLMVYSWTIVTVLLYLFFWLGVGFGRMELCGLVAFMAVCAPPFQVERVAHLIEPRLLFLLLVAALMIRRLWSGRVLFQVHSFLVVLGLFFCWLVVSTAMSEVPYRSLRELLVYGMGMAFALMVAEVLESAGDLCWFAGATVLSSLIVLGCAGAELVSRVVQLGLWEGLALRPWVLETDPQTMGFHAAMGFALLVLALLVGPRSRLFGVVVAVLVVLLGLFLVLQYDPLLWITTLLMVSVVYRWGRRRAGVVRRRILVFAGYSILGLFVVALLVRPQWTMARSVAPLVNALDPVVDAGRAIVPDLGARWLRGQGLNTRLYTFPRAYARIRPYEYFDRQLLRAAPTLGLELLAALGVVGLVLGCVVLLWMVGQFLRLNVPVSQQMAQTAGRAAVAGMFIDGVGHYRLGDLGNAHLLWLVLGMAVWLKILLVREIQREQRPLVRSAANGLVALLLAGLAAFVALDATGQALYRRGGALLDKAAVVAARIQRGQDLSTPASDGRGNQNAVMTDGVEHWRCTQLLARAETALRAASRVNPWDPSIRFTLGRCLMQQGDPRGLRLMQEMATRNPRSAYFRNLLAVALMEKGEYEAALEAAREAAEIDPSGITGGHQAVRARAALALGRWDEVRSAVKEAIMLAPFSALVLQGLGKLSDRFSSAELIDEIRDEVLAASLPGSSFRILTRRVALAYYLIGEYERAVRFLEPLSAISPSLETSIWLVRLEEALGRPARAEELLSGALARDPRTPVLLIEAAKHWISVRQPVQAAAAAWKSLRYWDSPIMDNALAHLVLAEAARQRSDHRGYLREQAKLRFIYARHAHQRWLERFTYTPDSLRYEQELLFVREIPAIELLDQLDHR